MTLLNNPNFIGFDGTPITGRTPTQTIVMSDGERIEMLPQLRAEVAHAYKLFCDAVNVSAFPMGYHVLSFKFGDGSKARMESNNGVHKVMVWPTGASGDDELIWGIGVCVLDSSGELYDKYKMYIDDTGYPQPLVITPQTVPEDNKVSNGNWKITKVKRLHGGNKLWVDTDRKLWLSALSKHDAIDPLSLQALYAVQTNPYPYGPIVNTEWNTIEGQKITTYSDVYNYPGKILGNKGRYLFRGNDTYRLMAPASNTPNFFVCETETQGTFLYSVVFPNTWTLQVFRQANRPRYGLWKQGSSTTNDPTLVLVETFSAPAAMSFYVDGFSVSPDGKTGICLVSSDADIKDLYVELSFGDNVTIEYKNAGGVVNGDGTIVTASGGSTETASSTEEPMVKVATGSNCDGSTFAIDTMPQSYYNGGFVFGVGEQTLTEGQPGANQGRIYRQWHANHSASAPNRSLSYVMESIYPSRIYVGFDGIVSTDYYHEKRSMNYSGTASYTFNYSAVNITPSAYNGWNSTDRSGSSSQTISDTWTETNYKKIVFASGSEFYKLHEQITITDSLTDSRSWSANTYTWNVSGTLTGSFVRFDRDMLFYDPVFDFSIFTEVKRETPSISGVVNNSGSTVGGSSYQNYDFTSLTPPTANYRIVAKIGADEVFAFSLPVNNAALSAIFRSDKRIYTFNNTSYGEPFFSSGRATVLNSHTTQTTTKFGVVASHTYPPLTLVRSGATNELCPGGSYNQYHHVEVPSTLNYNNGQSTVTYTPIGSAAILDFFTPYDVGGNPISAIENYCHTRYARDPKTLAVVVNLTLKNAPLVGNKSFFFAVDHTGFKLLSDILDLPDGSEPVVWNDAAHNSLVTI